MLAIDALSAAYKYLDFQFEATGRPAEEAALDHLLAVTGGHPRRTQQLAWEAWNGSGSPGLQVLAELGLEAGLTRLLASILELLHLLGHRRLVLRLFHPVLELVRVPQHLLLLVAEPAWRAVILIIPI